MYEAKKGKIKSVKKLGFIKHAIKQLKYKNLLFSNLVLRSSQLLKDIIKEIVVPQRLVNFVVK